MKTLARSLPILKNRGIYPQFNRDMPVFVRKFHLDKQTMAFFLAIGLLVIGGINMLLYSTPEGLGLNDDSIAYIAGARSLMAGDGYRAAWLISNEPMTHFPPGFSGTLALIGLVTGLDPVRGARLLNLSLFGLNILLSGLLGWRMTKSRLFGILAALLFGVTGSLLLIHSDALSEAFYVFFTLLAFLLLSLYFDKEKVSWLILLGCVLGLAYLVRYAALALWATLIVVLFLLSPTWRKRIVSNLILMASALPWAIAWSIRNRMVGGSITNRVASWHPIANEDLQFGLRTFSEFLFPVDSWRAEIWRIVGATEVIIAILLLGLLIWVVFVGLRRFFRPGQTIHVEVISFTNGLYIFAYLSALLTTMTFFDVATRFQPRLLAPMYPSFLLLFVYFVAWLWQRSHKVWKVVAISAFILVVGVSAYSEFQTVEYLHRGGQVYASWRWRNSGAMAFLRELPPGVIIHTNQCSVVYLYTERPCTVFPTRRKTILAQKREVRAGRVVFAFFSNYGEGVETLKDYQALTKDLYPNVFNGDEVYTAPPP